MLILTRMEGETIIFGDDIKVTVMDVQGAQVKLGIQAPLDVSIHREEVWTRIDETAAA